MNYACRTCSKLFRLEEEASFCPFCGGDIAKAMSAIWEETATRNSRLAKQVADCFSVTQSLMSIKVMPIIKRHHKTEFAKDYLAAKNSDSRAMLLSRVENIMKKFHTMVLEADDNLAGEMALELDEVQLTMENQLRSLLSLIGDDVCAEAAKHLGTTKNNAAIVKYKKVQLLSLYKQVEAAYEKYKRCVAENNMFAAFSSDSNYGSFNNIPSRFRFQGEDEEDDGEDASGEALFGDHDQDSHEAVMEELRTKNALPYQGFLDEDHVPHVDAFWYGLKHLAAFLDSRVDLKADGVLRLFQFIEKHGEQISETIESSGIVFEAALEEALEEYEEVNRKEILQILEEDKKD